MIFLDNIGFIALLGLVSQAALAWLLAAFFRVAASPGRPWVGLLQGAYLSLAVGLTAIAVRFVMSFREEVYPWLVEGSAPVRFAYAIYLAGKLSFVWLLVAALASLRDRGWPRLGPGYLVTLAVGAAVGAGLVRIDHIMGLQAPVVLIAYAWAVRLLWPARSERTDIGHRVVACVLALHVLVWGAYLVAEVVIAMQEKGEDSAWNLVMRLNSPIDLALQVVLGIGLVVMMMDGVHQSIVAAQRDRDAVIERMRRAEKMRTLNTLVGGVAHEINNPLTVILGFADDLSLDDAEVRGSAARVVREQAQRCRAIVQRLSILSEAREPRREPIDVWDVVDRVVRGVEPQLRAAGIALVTEGVRERLIVSAEPAALEQVLTNLIVNALHVSTRGDEVVLKVAAGADAVVFAVEDMGPGVPVEDRERVFEPFYTTKAPGAGTGLGLAVARALVAAHRGEIRVEDSPRGARFVFALTRGTAADPARPAAKGEVVLPAERAGAGLLVVDDEPLVREMIARRAARAGWRVEHAASVDEALARLFGGNGSGIAAVVCDLRLPGQSGAVLHDRLVADAPDWLARLVFVTGDLSSTESAAFARRCRSPIFTKPLDLDGLLGCLREKLLAGDGRRP
ncbi:MAG: hybrid sensor histidine kinase/response regulator [Planctomycetota bacterium]